MAAQPDISAILAALAAQRPAGTPTQTAQSSVQPPPIAGYPGVVSAATPANPSAGIALPQPSNSGSLDLSQIKPQASGSVSIADAIAKAQKFAADKAPREDPRTSARTYTRSRSRSRSPPRHENFRDNYNPYRDERRDDRSNGRDFGRERSVSPAGRARGTFAEDTGRGYQARSPPARSGGGGGGNNSEIITVDSDCVGLIIGRAGENLRRVEAETGARVQFITGPEASGPHRQCRISGTPRQIADARDEIFRVAAENPNKSSKKMSPPINSAGKDTGRASQSSNQPALREGERSMQIMVPDRTVGLIIGRGGETIRDLQERSGCHVNIVGENKSVNGLRPVNLIGSREAAAKAKDLIMEVVESDTRTGGTPAPVAAPPPVYGRGPAYDPYGAPAGYDPYGGGSQRINDVVVVPSEAVGMIIGKGGETIKDMQNATGCKINVSPPNGADIDREIGLVGTRLAIENAKRAIWDKVGTVREKQGGPLRGDGRPYNDPYTQHQPPQYGQPGPQLMPPQHAMPPPIGMDPSAADPYAAYGGYQNYMALWYAAFANQQGGPLPPGQ